MTVASLDRHPDQKHAAAGARQAHASSVLSPAPEQALLHLPAESYLPCPSAAQPAMPGSVAGSRTVTLLNLSPRRPACLTQRQVTTGLAAQVPRQDSRSTACSPLPERLHEAASDQQLRCQTCGAAPWVFIQPEDGVSAGTWALATPEMDQELTRLRPPLFEMPPGHWTHAYHAVLGLMPILSACHVCGRRPPKDPKNPKKPLGDWDHVFIAGMGVTPVLRCAPPSHVQQAAVQTQQAGQACGASASQAAAPKLSQIPNIPPSTQPAPSGIGPKPSVPSRGTKRKQPTPAVPQLSQLASMQEFWQYWDEGGALTLYRPVKGLLEELAPGCHHEWVHAAAHILSEAMLMRMIPEDAAYLEERIRKLGCETVSSCVKSRAKEYAEKSSAAAGLET